jgi:hypothetical protein
MSRFGFDAQEWRVLRAMRTPSGIQKFLDHEVGYDKEEDGPRCRSPRLVLRDRKAHCMSGALFAAAALRVLGHRPLVVDLEAVRDDDHVIAVYRNDGCWGAVAKSNYSGLRSREPVYRSVRELVMSYFEGYYNLKGEKTLRNYSRPVNLSRFDRMEWMTADRDVWEIPEHLCEVAHTPVMTLRQTRALARMDDRLYIAGMVGMAE